MRASRWSLTLAFVVAGALSVSAGPGQEPAATRKPAAPADARLEGLKRGVAAEVDALQGLTQQMVDSLFSFAEVGFQEFETQAYCRRILEARGFTVQQGVAGIPSAWVATWGAGRPVIAFGSDVDGLLETSQKPGVVTRAPFVEGAPGHGEGHNTGVPLSITAALALKAILERERIPGTIRVWPGIAEELVGGKAQFVKAGVFKDVDVCLFAHVSSGFGVSWGASGGTGLVSVEYRFAGTSAHAASAPWAGRSALDAVELMDIGWNFRREHLRLTQRSHYVVTGGGSQPNVVPPSASVWYYFRDASAAYVRELWDLGNTMANAAAAMTGTTVSWRLLGSAWPQHMNKAVAEAAFANIERVGMPAWSDDDQAFARLAQRSLKVREQGLATTVGTLDGPVKPEDNRGGASDDIGDVSWTVPTITLRYPANVPGLPGHHWAGAIAEATPIAHKGVTAGAKVQAMTALDLLLRPALVQQAWDYFRTVQAKEADYRPFPGPDDKPATWLNEELMRRLRPELRKYYYDPAKYKTYLEQLGIPYPPRETDGARPTGG